MKSRCILFVRQSTRRCFRIEGRSLPPPSPLWLVFCVMWEYFYVFLNSWNLPSQKLQSEMDYLWIPSKIEHRQHILSHSAAVLQFCSTAAFKSYCFIRKYDFEPNNYQKCAVSLYWLTQVMVPKLHPATTILCLPSSMTIDFTDFFIFSSFSV